MQNKSSRTKKNQPKIRIIVEKRVTERLNTQQKKKREIERGVGRERRRTEWQKNKAPPPSVPNLSEKHNI